MALPSPCVQICVVDPLTGLCEGCGRSLSEIGRWAGMSEDEQRKVLKTLASRLKVLRAHRREEPEEEPTR